jgi:hypothetical protein
MRFVAHLPAEPGTVLAPDAVAGWADQPVKVTVPGHPDSIGRVVEAEVVEDGSAVRVVLEVDDDLAGIAGGLLAYGLSFEDGTG